MINYHIKGLYKTACYKTKSKFSQCFFSHILLHKWFFSFLIKAFASFEKLIRFYWEAFIAYKNRENLKMLIEIFYQKLIDSNVILAFLDFLRRPTMVADIERHLFPECLDPPLHELRVMAAYIVELLQLELCPTLCTEIRWCKNPISNGW